MEKFIRTITTGLAICSILILANTETQARDFDFTIAMDTTEVLSMAEVMPEIEGGLKKIYENIEYPREARMNNVEGRVFVKFIVDENGNVQNPEVLKDIGAGCGEAAIEGIKKVKFKPGMQNGQPVSVYYTLPVTFKLAD